LARPIFRCRHNPKVGTAVIAGSVIFMINILSVALSDSACFFHLCTSSIALGSTFDLFGLTVVIPILLGVVSDSWHKLSHGLVSVAFPLLARKAVGGVGVFSPISFDLVGSSAIGIALFSSWANAITAIFSFSSLSVVNGSSTSCCGVLYDFSESLFNGGHICGYYYS